jgi:hypothetical protein
METAGNTVIEGWMPARVTSFRWAANLESVNQQAAYEDVQIDCALWRTVLRHGDVSTTARDAGRGG